jgi:hypothetical protein
MEATAGELSENSAAALRALGSHGGIAPRVIASVVLAYLALVVVSSTALAVPGTISTLAGDPLVEGLASTFGQSVSAIAVSGQTLYVADNHADVIRAVNISTDEESVIAGTSAAGIGGDGGPASAAELDDPEALAADSQSDLLIADSSNGRIRLIAATDCSSDCPYGLEATTKGDIYTIAGLGLDIGFSEGPAVGSGLGGEPRALAIDAHGDLTISDRGLVLMVADYDCSEGCPYGLASMAKGNIYHVAGREYDEEYAGDGEPATSTGMKPEGLAEDGEGNLVIVDSDNAESRVLLVAAADCAAGCPYGLRSMTAGYVYTIAGGGSESPESNGLATNASISPSEALLDARGDVLLTGGFEEGHALILAAETCASACAYGLAATTENHIYTIAGGGSSLENGVPGTQARLIGPRSMELIPNGGLLVVSNLSVRLLAGTACAGGCPFGLPATSANDMYTVAGNGTAAFSGESGRPGELELASPRAVTSTNTGDVLVLDAGNGRVRIIAAADCGSDCAYGLPSTVQGDMYTIAGGGSSLENGVPAMSESLFGVRAGGEPNYEDSPTSMTTDAAGDVLVLDGGNRIRLIAASNCAANCPYGLSAMAEGDIYTVVGNGGHGYGGDGGPATSAELGDGARGMAVDPEGDLLIADTSNNRVRLLANVSCASDCPYGLPATTKGDIYTIVGTGEAGSKGDNKPAADAELAEPADVAVDRDGNLLIADTLAVRVRFVAARSCSSDCPYSRSGMTAGDIYPLAGTGALFYPQEVGADGDGSSATIAKMQPPQAVAADSAGNVLIGEYEGSGGRSVVRMVAAATCSSGCAYGLPATVKGDIYTIVGVNFTISGFSGDGGPATSAYLNGPSGLGFDSAGDLLIADTFNNRVRLVAAAGKPEPEGSAGPEHGGTGSQPEGQVGPSSGPGQPEAGLGGATFKSTVPTNGGVRVTLRRHTLVAAPRGMLTLVLDLSQPTPGRIRLTRSIRLHGKHYPQLLARARFSTGRARTVRLRLRLTHTGLVLLKSRRRLSCVLTVIPAHDAGPYPTFSLNIVSGTSVRRHGR